MSMPASARPLTVDDIRAMRTNERMVIELIDGEVFVSPTPSARHDVLKVRLINALLQYLEPLGLADAIIVGPAELTWGTRDTYVDPDIWVTDLAERYTFDWNAVHTVKLAIEIISPSSRRRDRVTKRELYARMGVDTYWIVDPERHTVEESMGGDTSLRQLESAMEWRATAGAPAFVLPLATLFAGIPKGAMNG
ncbi:MAG: Uma2 family endonuclease [Gemmatimonadaceae bacterium]|nr:Uma2 family endonuclease [Gemmatimonadaceae bacterium]